MRFRAGENDRAFVNLVKRIRRDDDGPLARTIDDRLGECEQGLATAINGQYLLGGIDFSALVTLFDPSGDGMAQRLAAGGRRIT